jgi:hypothetical protein
MEPFLSTNVHTGCKNNITFYNTYFNSKVKYFSTLMESNLFLITDTKNTHSAQCGLNMGTVKKLKLKINRVILNSITGNTMCCKTPENRDRNPGVLQYTVGITPS